MPPRLVPAAVPWAVPWCGSAWCPLRRSCRPCRDRRRPRPPAVRVWARYRGSGDLGRTLRRPLQPPDGRPVLPQHALVEQREPEALVVGDVGLLARVEVAGHGGGVGLREDLTEQGAAKTPPLAGRRHAQRLHVPDGFRRQCLVDGLAESAQLAHGPRSDPCGQTDPVSYTHLRAHETRHDLVCRLLLEKKKKQLHRLLVKG